MTLEEIAKQLGTSKTNLTRALSIERNLANSMKELLDTGEITKTFESHLSQIPLYAIFIQQTHIHTSRLHNKSIQGIFIS